MPIDRFHLARPGKDNAASPNRALSEGKNLLFTPGDYQLDDSIVVTRPNTIILGLGFPNVAATTGKPVLTVEADEGVMIGGLIIDAGERESETLIQIGRPGKKAGKAENPIVLQDITCRVGGPALGKAKCMLTIYTNDVVGENLWLWRADHGRGVGWDKNTNANGLRVEGDNVTMYGLFVEHTQEYQTLWNGNGGRVTSISPRCLTIRPPTRCGTTAKRWLRVLQGGRQGHHARGLGHGSLSLLPQGRSRRRTNPSKPRRDRASRCTICSRSVWTTAWKAAAFGT